MYIIQEIFEFMYMHLVLTLNLDIKVVHSFVLVSHGSLLSATIKCVGLKDLWKLKSIVW